MNNFYLHFSGDHERDRVKFGGSPGGGFNYGAKVAIENNTQTSPALNYGYGLYAVSKSNADFRNIGVGAEAKDISGMVFSPNNIGMFAEVEGEGTQTGFLAQIVSSSTSTAPIFGLDVSGGCAYGSTGNAYGVRTTISNQSNVGFGVWGECVNSLEKNYGGYFSTWQGGDDENYGVYASASNETVSDRNYGVYANGSAAINENYGIYATAGGPTTSVVYAGYFNGDTYCTGSYLPSDARYKKNIIDLKSSIDLVKNLRPVSYNFKSDENPNLNLPSQRQYGFISQEVEKVLPELTKFTISPPKFNKEGKEIFPKQEILALNYNGFIALLTKAIQEQQMQIDELKSTRETANDKTPVAGSAVEKELIEIKLSDKNVMVLNQNVPNPFAESTTISYNVPVDFTKAQIIFTTSEGLVIKAVTLSKKGPGSLTVFADDLSHGLYTYTLVVDGKSIDSKKMIKE